MQIFFGSYPHSQFSHRRLLQQVQACNVPIQALHAYPLYCLDLESSLNEDEFSRLRFLLGHINETVSAEGIHLRVLPRADTISPWSSKATEILHIAGLSKVRRIEYGRHYILEGEMPSDEHRTMVANLLHDRMTEQVVDNHNDTANLFASSEPRPLEVIAFGENPVATLTEINHRLSLALSANEIAYLADYYQGVNRSPTDAELMMFAQVNSEHCRHHIFNAKWKINGSEKKSSLFDMVRYTHACQPDGVLVAYDDNAAVIEGANAARWQVNPVTREYEYIKEQLPILMKVETHNHPTAISPFPGAATGAGGEIRDETATGRGGRPKAGLCGFSVSNLRIPDAIRAWEDDESQATQIASPLQIMLEAPIGAAAFNNEFGRPCLTGYFRTFESFDNRECQDGKTPFDRRHRLGYHKPIMIAGGLGNLRRTHVRKQKFPPQTPIVVLGGPAMLIGLRGGTASSQIGGAHDSLLDFESVQRGNAEMQRRCQEVVEQCTALGSQNPIVAIHDVGAGGLANAVPELIAEAGVGGHFELRHIPSADNGMSPMEIWCNEAQERYVIAVNLEQLDDFTAICKRERCPMSVIGKAVRGKQIKLNDRLFGNEVISMPLPTLFGKAIKKHKDISTSFCKEKYISTDNIAVDEAVERILKLPAVASKSFLITIGDRSVGGLSTRDQMVGPWQVPVADCAVCATDFIHYTGEAMAVGERSPVALIDAPASSRLAVVEAITNIMASDVQKLSDIRLSANWMASCGNDEDDFSLFSAVQAIAEELCPELGIAIPVGKDSLSMQISWRDKDEQEKQVKAPLSLIVSAFAPVGDVRRTWTPQLRVCEDCRLFLFDLSNQRGRLGGSALAQVFGLHGGPCADLDDPVRLKNFFDLLANLRNKSGVIAYHDRSDGGLFVTLCEMAFAGQCGLEVNLDALDGDALSILFAEEPGAVLQVTAESAMDMMALANQYDLGDSCFSIGHVCRNKTIHIYHGKQTWEWDLMDLKRSWWDTNYRLQSLRDNAECAQEELDSVCDVNASGLSAKLTFDLEDSVVSSTIPQSVANIAGHVSPKVAILREQGVNGHMEMAAAFNHAGFTTVDVHMSDLLTKTVSLNQFHGLAVCGGFSYGDVLGAGRGWAASILFDNVVRDEFTAFFSRDDTFTLGVCNGCQMLSQIKTLIPDAKHFPYFGTNRSEQFESRLCMVEIMDSPSILLRGMAGSHLPVVVAHGEGRVVFDEHAKQDDAKSYVCLRYADRPGSATMTYPANPNGSPEGITALCSEDGRVTIMMPHPERLFRRVQYSWCPDDWKTMSPWFKLFLNARRWVGF